MRKRSVMAGVFLLANATACQGTINTLPQAVSPTAPIGYSDLEVPAGLEVRSVDFAAATFSDASSAPGGPVSSSVGGRAFVKVYAVDRTSGEQYLLLYEDIARRPRPIQIIRFHAGTMSLSADSTH